MDHKSVNYLNLPFINMSYNQILVLIKQHIENKEGIKITIVDLKTLVKSFFSKKLSLALQEFDVIIPKGIFLNQQIKRVYPQYQYNVSEGRDLVAPLFRKYHQSQLNFMLFGGTLGDKKTLMIKLQTSFPEIKVIGIYSKRFVKEHLEDVRSMVIKGDVGVLLVGLGQPKDELWVSRNQDVLKNVISICINETVEIMSGEKTDIPYKYRVDNKEFQYRMKRNPLRIFDVFIWIYIWHKTFWFKRKVKKKRKIK